MSKPRLLIIGRPQFGYHTGCFYYCKYLRDQYDITYLGWDFGFAAVEMQGISVIHLRRDGGKLLRFVRFLRSAAREARNSYNLRFVMHFPGCSLLLGLAGHRNSWVLDIRTASVDTSRIRRSFEDWLLKLEARCFKNITVISAGVAERLGLRSCHILPPGAQVMSVTRKDFTSSVRLLYVGTISNRGIGETLRGFRAWLSSAGVNTDARYTLIGGGFRGEEQTLACLIEELGLGDVVDFLGWLPHTELAPYFDSHNIGVAFIPTTPYYEHQPAFKTMEYLLAGMAVLATGTAENRRLVTPACGEIIGASSAGFREGLARLLERSGQFSSDAIRAENRGHEWPAIIDANLRPYLARLLSSATEKGS